MNDLIDRDALEAKIRENSMRIRFFDPSVNVILQLIRYAPAVNRWIPVEDDLPDGKEDVLVWFEYFRYGEYDCLYQTYGIGNYNKNYDGWMVNHETGWDQLRVIAWMPMPDAYEPPKEGADDA